MENTQYEKNHGFQIFGPQINASYTSIILQSFELTSKIVYIVCILQFINNYKYFLLLIPLSLFKTMLKIETKCCIVNICISFFPVSCCFWRILKELCSTYTDFGGVGVQPAIQTLVRFLHPPSECLGLYLYPGS